MSHGSEQSEDYWPGYVDALTSMVQVLAFVMMLLAMAVFVLSQSVSKGAVEAIAKAANIDVPADANVSELTSKVVKYIEQHQSASPEKASEGSTAAPSAPAMPATGATTDTKSQAAASAANQAVRNEPAPVSSAAAESTLATPKEQRFVSHPSTNPEKPLEPAADAKRITLSFAPHSFKLDPNVSANVANFLVETHAGDAKTQLLIRAYASSADGALSEARRLAYYRALTVRRELTDRKIRPEDIRINVYDTPDKDRGGAVDVFVGGGS